MFQYKKSSFWRIFCCQETGLLYTFTILIPSTSLFLFFPICYNLFANPMSYPSLSEIVLETIDLYSSRTDLPQIDLTQFHTPLVVGSGNGYYTGRIVFRDIGAYYANESEVDRKLENIPSITDVVVVSASGEKHAPIILEAAKRHGKNTFLISSSESSTGRSIADHSIIMPKIREPYTYNTSTYFGYMLAETPDIDLLWLRDFLITDLTLTLHTSLLSFSEGESDPVIASESKQSSASERPEQDVSHSFDMTGAHIPDSPLEGSAKRGVDSVDFSRFSSFFLVIPDQFVLLREMFEVKFIELFGRKVARDVFSYEQMKHATTVVQDGWELFICFGNDTWITYGANQINLPIYDATSYAPMMLVGYYVIGQIQEALPQYFDESIEDYCVRAQRLSGFNIKPWVEV